MGGSLDSLVESAIVCDECGLWTLDCGFWTLDWEGDDEDDVVKAIVGGRLAAGCACDECGEVRVVHSVESTSVERLGWVHAPYSTSRRDPRPLASHWSSWWRAGSDWLGTGCQPDGGRMAACGGQRGLTTPSQGRQCCWEAERAVVD